MSARGYYGFARVGQSIPAAPTVYVERETSTTGWIVGTVAVVGAALWARYQSQQIEQLHNTMGLPYQSFTSTAGASLRGLAKGLIPKGRAAQ
jgi:hypothetical protein